LEKVKGIMAEEVDRGHIDAHLVDLLFNLTDHDQWLKELEG